MRLWKRLSVAIGVALFGGMLPGQDSGLMGPVSGLVFDEHTKSLRPILGIPGASYLGAPIAEGLDLAAVSPNGKLVVAVRGSELLGATLGGSEVQWSVLEETGAVDRIVWSADSSSIVVSGGSLVLWRDLPGEPERIPITGVEGAVWVQFAVEPGARAAFAVTQGGLYRLSDSEPQLLAAIASPGGLALARSSDVVYVADRSTPQVLAIRHWRESPEVSWIAGGSSGIGDPVALAIADDGRSLLVADRSSRSLLELDPETGAISKRWELDFEPARLDRLASGLFVVNLRAAVTSPLQVFAAQAQAPSVFFVPAGAGFTIAGNSETLRD